jgi:hypothetical protein
MILSNETAFFPDESPPAANIFYEENMKRDSSLVVTPTESLFGETEKLFVCFGGDSAAKYACPFYFTNKF